MSKIDMSNNAQHVYFLQKKKAEILAKKQREKAAQEGKPKTPPVEVKKETGIQLPFANDGSFLERFKMMQQQQQQKQKSEESSTSLSQKIDDASKLNTHGSANIKKETNDEPIISGNSSGSEKQSLKMLPVKSQPELKAPASIFKQEDEADAYQPSDYDLAKGLAEKVAEEGMTVESEARQKYQGDSRYRFLFDPSSPVAQYYQSELKHFKQIKPRKRRWDDSEGNESTTDQSSSSQEPSTSATLNQTPSSSVSPIDPMIEFAKAKALIQAKAAALTSGSVPIPTNVISEEEKKRQKAIEEQRMMNELYRKVIEQQAIFAANKVRKQDPNKPKYEYDSDEDTEGGTWEHKKRRAEMRKTEEWAGQLTDKARGKHHLSDFLPPEELEKFMENVKAVQEGRQADISDYAKFKIQADNVGFQLLQKAGWEEGTGLGKKGDGIIQPINKGKTSFDQAGVGAEKPLDVKADDDDFELYRKRMMLAYKFRPNPMNNPRRPYY